MDFTKISNWLQITANVGIVGGLLLVGVQLEQNTDLLKTQLLYEESSRMVELETKVIGENAAKVWAKSLTDPQNLTLADTTMPQDLVDAVNARLSEASPDSTLEYMQGKFEYLDLPPADGVITPA
jgi:hypothetical protein